MIGRFTKGFEDYVPFLLRLTLAVIFILRGAEILFGYKYGGFYGFSAHVYRLGFSPPMLWAGLAIAAQFLGGIFLLMGFWTRYAAGSIVALMIVAIFWQGLYRSWAEFEFPFVLLMMASAVLTTGSGNKMGMDVKLAQQDKV